MNILTGIIGIKFDAVVSISLLEFESTWIISNLKFNFLSVLEFCIMMVNSLRDFDKILFYLSSS